MRYWLEGHIILVIHGALGNELLSLHKQLKGGLASLILCPTADPSVHKLSSFSRGVSERHYPIGTIWFSTNRKLIILP